MTSTGPPAVTVVEVTVVTSPACHYCEDAQAALAVLARAYPIEVRLADAQSPAGQKLLRQHGSGMFPLVVMDGTFFSAGRLPRRKLERLLAARAGAPAEVWEQ